MTPKKYWFYSNFTRLINFIPWSVSLSNSRPMKSWVIPESIILLFEVIYNSINHLPLEWHNNKAWMQIEGETFVTTAETISFQITCVIYNHSSYFSFPCLLLFMGHKTVTQQWRMKHFIELLYSIYTSCIRCHFFMVMGHTGNPRAMKIYGPLECTSRNTEHHEQTLTMSPNE